MKKFIYLLVFLNFQLVSFSQSDSSVVCRFGFAFEISVQKSWGYDHPVVLSVSPRTSADSEGLKANDIIEAVNDKSTKGETYETVFSWLQNSANDRIKLKVSNLEETDKVLFLTSRCSLKNALTEKDLVDVYAFYSLEDAQTRLFTCPFKTSVTQSVNLRQYKTFGFSNQNVTNAQLEGIINTAIRKSLEKKGMKYSGNNPDLLIASHYSHKKNPNYRSNGNADKFPIECRYNMNTRLMENLPIYYNPLIHSSQAEYLLNFGFCLIDPRRPSNDNTIWECEASELLQINYSLGDYAQFHIPLMLMQYPYLRSADTSRFFYSRMRYNYTGINYNINKLKEIIDVDKLSPAAQAGFQSGDVIEKINGIKINGNPKSADSDYKQFIYKTMPLRDSKTRFTNAEGFSKCMYWGKVNYAQIYDEFRRPEFSTCFSYLFYFEPYINLSGTNIVNFNIVRGKQKQEVKVRPVIVEEEVFENR
jgi:hypothetical protein